VEFPGKLPAIYEALRLREGERTLILEVAQHLDPRTVRAIAMAHTEGVARGLTVEATSQPVQVPVGPETLGRLFNAMGEPLDGREPLSQVRRWSIHRAAPSLEAQRHGLTFLETGIKVIDLLAPLARGGKADLSAARGSARRFCFKN
jgi:F0F1-type ATP synthase beta subunit